MIACSEERRSDLQTERSLGEKFTCEHPTARQPVLPSTQPRVRFCAIKSPQPLVRHPLQATQTVSVAYTRGEEGFYTCDEVDGPSHESCRGLVCPSAISLEPLEMTEVAPREDADDIE